MLRCENIAVEMGYSDMYTSMASC